MEGGVTVDHDIAGLACEYGGGDNRVGQVEGLGAGCRPPIALVRKSAWQRRAYPRHERHPLCGWDDSKRIGVCRNRIQIQGHQSVMTGLAVRLACVPVGVTALEMALPKRIVEVVPGQARRDPVDARIIEERPKPLTAVDEVASGVEVCPPSPSGVPPSASRCLTRVASNSLVTSSITSARSPGSTRQPNKSQKRFC